MIGHFGFEQRQADDGQLGCCRAALETFDELLAHIASRMARAPRYRQKLAEVPLGAADWLFSVGVASSVLWLREASKLLARRRA